VIAVRSFGRTLPDRLGAERCAALALVAIAAGLACIAATGTVAGLFAGTGLAALGHALGFPALMTIAIRRAQPGERGAAVATIAAGSQVAIGAGAATVGYRAVFVVGAAVAASGLLVLRAAGRPAAAGP
jgi:predicted MFS family arabinose efflux permease